MPGARPLCHRSEAGSATARDGVIDSGNYAVYANRLSSDSSVISMPFKPTNKLRILVLLHEDLIPPEKLEEGVVLEKQPWRTEYDVISTLRSMGHEVRPAGLHSDLAV